jgi:hypothetical protein
MKETLINYPITILRRELINVRTNYRLEKKRIVEILKTMKAINKLTKDELIELLIKHNYDISKLPKLEEIKKEAKISTGKSQVKTREELQKRKEAKEPKFSTGESQILTREELQKRKEAKTDKENDLYLKSLGLDNISNKRWSGDEFIKYKDIYEKAPVQFLRKAIKSGVNMNKILEFSGYSKGAVDTTNSFFTPYEYIDELIYLSGLSQSQINRPIDILEGQAGIGNFIDRLLLLKSSNFFNIDVNEPIKYANDILQAKFGDNKNINITSKNFFDFDNNKKYDYIFGNPPFNIKIGNKTYYDTDFVYKSYEMLKDGGTLAFIISSGFKNGNDKRRREFRKFYEENNRYNTETIKGFKKGEEGTFDLGTTNVNMEYIVITKYEDEDE